VGSASRSGSKETLLNSTKSSRHAQHKGTGEMKMRHTHIWDRENIRKAAD